MYSSFGVWVNSELLSLSEVLFHFSVMVLLNAVNSFFSFPQPERGSGHIPV